MHDELQEPVKSATHLRCRRLAGRQTQQRRQFGKETVDHTREQRRSVERELEKNRGPREKVPENPQNINMRPALQLRPAASRECGSAVLPVDEEAAARPHIEETSLAPCSPGLTNLVTAVVPMVESPYKLGRVRDAHMCGPPEEMGDPVELSVLASLPGLLDNPPWMLEVIATGPSYADVP